MAHVTAATPQNPPLPPTPAVPPTGLPPSVPDGSYQPSPRVRFANWMERTFGRAYLPIAMVAGGAIGGGLGLLTLGPIGGVVGALGGAMLAGTLIFSD